MGYRVQPPAGDPAACCLTAAASLVLLHPIPPLDRRQPSTSFKVRGRELRVDFLTPAKDAATSKPTFLPAYGLSAKPLRHLDYLIAEPQQAVILGSDVVLVNLPSPARFAIHKLWFSSRRPPAFQAKALKDRLQAGQLIEVLLEDRPDDLREAWSALPTEKARGIVRRTAGAFEGELKDRFLELLTSNS